MSDTRIFQATKVARPDIEDDDLFEVQSLDGDRNGRLDRFDLAGGSWRALELTDRQFTEGRVRELKVTKATLTRVNMTSVAITRCDLSSADWRECKLDRVEFSDCKLLGTVFADVSMEDVQFTFCKLDMATFESLRAKGPVKFYDCVLDEATFTGCDLTGAAIEHCSMRETAFERGTYKNLDLRSNDLSGIRGAAELRRVVIEPAQTIQLGQALAADLDMRIPDHD